MSKMVYPLKEVHKVKVSVTVDPALLKAVDKFVREHPELDRSSVVNAALLLWYGEQQETEIAAQHRAPQSTAEREEREAWHRVQVAAIEHPSRKG
ncbi:MAG TPA: hypothetical protein VMW65_00750 [Chloroflexota bacterium]|nr:hypothetical protein [Chloroflexota bacterium]